MACNCEGSTRRIAELEKEITAQQSELVKRGQQLNVAVNALQRLAESHGWRPIGRYSEGEIAARRDFASDILRRLGVKE